MKIIITIKINGEIEVHEFDSREAAQEFIDTHGKENVTSVFEDDSQNKKLTIHGPAGRGGK